MRKNLFFINFCANTVSHGDYYEKIFMLFTDWSDSSRHVDAVRLLKEK